MRLSVQMSWPAGNPASACGAAAAVLTRPFCHPPMYLSPFANLRCLTFGPGECAAAAAGSPAALAGASPVMGALTAAHGSYSSIQRSYASTESAAAAMGVFKLYAGLGRNLLYNLVHVFLLR
eukprot:GHUV01053428.1.p1 GENE.GHUV01053428.1~~GHUV01053428.1.p1  ORF type:complete len:122 (-),score=25.78 GHUV01053428.1:696-1061(-)